jgi:hypothetical protein
MSRVSRIRMAIVIAGAIASVCVVVALAEPGSSSRGGAQKKLELVAAPTPPEVSAPTSAQLGAAATLFGVFNRPKSTADSLPTGSAYAGGVARRIGPGSGPLEAWAVSAGDRVCVTAYAESGPARGGPAACDTVAALNGPDALLVDVTTTPATSSDEVIVGVVPQGVSKVTINFQDGTSAVVPVINNGFTYTSTDAKQIHDFTWSARGVAHVEEDQ